jgi:hypothetical protein
MVYFSTSKQVALSVPQQYRALRIMHVPSSLLIKFECIELMRNMQCQIELLVMISAVTTLQSMHAAYGDEMHVGIALLFATEESRPI